MRLPLIVLLGVAGYFGYNYYNDHKAEVDQRISALIASIKGGESAAPEAAVEETPQVAADAAPAVAPTPEFSSKIDVPTPEAGQKQYAPPGVFYAVERVSVTSTTGVKALSPGEKLKLVQRLPGGKMLVTTGDEDFEVRESQVTNDLDLAREAEKKDFVARGGVL